MLNVSVLPATCSDSDSGSKINTSHATFWPSFSSKDDANYAPVNWRSRRFPFKKGNLYMTFKNDAGLEISASQPFPRMMCDPEVGL